MYKKALIISTFIFLAILPAGMVWCYWQDALNYQNSPHINTIWDQSEPKVRITKQTPLRQDFKVEKTGLAKISLMIESADSEYQWQIKEVGGLYPIYMSTFNGRDVQNYDFLELKLNPNYFQTANQEYTLEITRLDEDNTPGIGVFKSAVPYQGVPSIVFQLYYAE